MPVTVIVGGQFGSEGKGKVAHALALRQSATVAVRVGGPNSGHTVIDPSGSPIILRQLPTAAILPGVTCVLGAGSYVDPDLLLREIGRIGLRPDRLKIDPNAAVITAREKEEEASTTLRRDIGSTLSGTGAAVGRRVARVRSLRLAKDEPLLKAFLGDACHLLRNTLDHGERVIVEGTQGFGLSLLHSPNFPFVTSRDTTAAGFIAEAGLSPMDVDSIVLVIRTFPIRVSGNSGPLPNEIDWETVQAQSLSLTKIVERTSVTRAIRRVGRFDAEIVRRAIVVNRPNLIALNHLDYIDAAVSERNEMTPKAAAFVADVESRLDAPINYLGFGASSLVGRQ